MMAKRMHSPQFSVINYQANKPINQGSL